MIFLCEGLLKVHIEHGEETLILKISSPVNLIGLSSLAEGDEVFQYSAAAYQKSIASLTDDWQICCCALLEEYSKQKNSSWT